MVALLSVSVKGIILLNGRMLFPPWQPAPLMLSSALTPTFPQALLQQLLPPFLQQKNQ